MKRTFLVLFSAVMLLVNGWNTAAESPHIVLTEAPSYIRPGKMERISFEADHEGLASLSLHDPEGKMVIEIFRDFKVNQGANHLSFNGMDSSMQPYRPGEYMLRLFMGADEVTSGIQIGDPGPQITHLAMDDAQVTPGKPWTLKVRVNMPGTLLAAFHEADQTYEIFHSGIPDGETVLVWDGLLDNAVPAAGLHTLSLVFVDTTGYPANLQNIALEVISPPETVTPEVTQVPPQTSATPEPAQAKIRYSVPTHEQVAEDELGRDYWRLPVGLWDEEAIWKVMQQPMTVLWGKDQRETYKLRAAKNDSMERENILGEITYESQGVHIIEQTSDGWSLVEAYNSSYGPDNRSRRGYGDTDELIRGYIRTSELKTVTPRDDYGILIDKLKQRLYVFKEGKLYTELIISTGIPTRQQPWNETPSGEFMMVSRVGDFNAGNLVCRMALRINGGVLIHEVPYIENTTTGYWDYASQEAQLGQKASHGCVRVQRLNNNEKINMTWLWNNIKTGTKVLVWDDFPGRFYEYPADDLPLFFNPDSGKYYHLDQSCSSIKNRFLPLKGEMSYMELENSEFQKLTPCPYCNPPMRKPEIDQINRDNGF